MSHSKAPTVVVGIYNHQDQAVKGIQALRNAGFPDEQIGVASREWTKHLEGVKVHEQHSAEHGAVTGALVGGGLGAALGLVGAILVPGAIPFLAGHALLAALGGGLAGASGGVFVGPFLALGIDKAESEDYARQLEQDKVAVLVNAPGREDEARALMVQQGAYDESMSASP